MLLGIVLTVPFMQGLFTVSQVSFVNMQIILGLAFVPAAIIQIIKLSNNIKKEPMNAHN